MQSRQNPVSRGIRQRYRLAAPVEHADASGPLRQHCAHSPVRLDGSDIRHPAQERPGEQPRSRREVHGRPAPRRNQPVHRRWRRPGPHPVISFRDPPERARHIAGLLHDSIIPSRSRGSPGFLTPGALLAQSDGR